VLLKRLDDCKLASLLLSNSLFAYWVICSL